MSDSPPKDDAVPGPEQTPNAADPTKSETAQSETAAPAGAALDDAAKAMDAVVVKPDVPAPSAPENKTETKSETTGAAQPDAAKDIEPPKQPGFTADPKPAIDLMQLSANTSGMHQQYVAPGVQRQSLLSSTKYQFFFFAALMLMGFFMLRGGIGLGGSDALGLQDAPTSSTTTPVANQDPQSGFPDPNNNVKIPPAVPQADFTVNAGAIGNPTPPVKKGDASLVDKGGYAEETADLEAARLMVDKDPNKALAMCDQHDVDYPRGILGPEARVIRVEAYAKKGDDARALSLGNDFLEDYPHSPRAGRVVAIVEAIKNKLDAGHP